MVLRPDSKIAQSGDNFVSAWEAVARAQKTNSESYRLVRQPDHARLSGEIAWHLAIADAPTVTDDIVQGIGLHDEGWSDFDSGRTTLAATPAKHSAGDIALSADGKPLSFLEIKAGDFLQAWRGSIEAAEAVAPIAGLMVSGHFHRIGKFGASTGVYSQEDAQQVNEFLRAEERRQQRLTKMQSRSSQEIEYWTDVLQFCDLLSLYLCCGSQENVEFPQRIGSGGETIRLQVREDGIVLSPSLFSEVAVFSLEAYAYPAEESTPTRLNWKMR